MIITMYGGILQELVMKRKLDFILWLKFPKINIQENLMTFGLSAE